MTNISIQTVMDILELPMSEVNPLLEAMKCHADNMQSLLNKFKSLCNKQNGQLWVGNS